MKEGELVWTLNVVSTGARDWSLDEIVLIKEVAERTWAAAERAKAEATLRDSDDRFRAFAAASTDILWICNVRTMKLEFVSSAFNEIYGAPAEQGLGGNELKRLARLLNREDRGRVFDAFRRVRAGEWVTHEYRILRPSDQQVRWIRDTDFPFQGNDRRIEHISSPRGDCMLAGMFRAMTTGGSSD